MIQTKGYYKDEVISEPLEVSRPIYTNGVSDLTIIPSGAKQTLVQANADNKYCFQHYGGTNLHIDGRVEGTRYGIIADGAGIGIPIKHMGDAYNTIIENVLCLYSSFTNFHIKNERDLIPSLWVKLHNCSGRESKGEFCYIGTTKADWIDALGFPQTSAKTELVEIINCISENSKWDGPQVNVAKKLLIDGFTMVICGIDATKPHQRHAWSIGIVDDVVIRNFVFSQAPSHGQFHGRTGTVLMQNGLLHDFGKGIHSQAEMVTMDNVFFKEMAKSYDANDSYIFMNEKGKFTIKSTCVFDTKLANELGNSKTLQNITFEGGSPVFEDLPEPEFVRNIYGDICLKPGTFYYEKGFGVNFPPNEIAVEHIEIPEGPELPPPPPVEEEPAPIEPDPTKQPEPVEPAPDPIIVQPEPEQPTQPEPVTEEEAKTCWHKLMRFFGQK